MKTASKSVKRCSNSLIGNANKHKNELTLNPHQLGKN